MGKKLDYEKVAIIYQDRQMQLTPGGVYTEYAMSEDATVADLPTDCRYGSKAYQNSTGNLYFYDQDGWGIVGGSETAESDGEAK